MLKEIRHKIIFTNILIVTLILVFFSGFMIIRTYADLMENAEMNLKQSINIDGNKDDIPHIGREREDPSEQNNKISLQNLFGSAGPQKDLKYLTRSVLVVKYNTTDGSVEKVVNNASMSDQTLSDAISEAKQHNKDFGALHDLDLYYYKSTNDNIITISFADSTQTQSYIGLVSLRYVIIGLIALVLLSFFSLLISKIAIKPIKKTWEQETRFVADVSHELKTPLTVILANNSIIKSHSDDTVAKQMNWIDSTGEEAEHMKKLINSMLDLARLESGGAKNSFVNVNFGNIINKCILQIEAVAFEKGINFSSDISGSVHILGDETQLKQLVIILTDNAVKYAQSKSTITIKLFKRRNIAVFTVNSLSYISSDDIPHIFERFYRADKSRNTDSDNSYGLGLAIASNIVENHKGKISVESSEKDGTTFTVSLRLK
jgi:two-component system sensor histidine kinase CiaH